METFHLLTAYTVTPLTTVEITAIYIMCWKMWLYGKNPR